MKKWVRSTCLRPQVMQAYPRAVQPGGKQVVDRELHTCRIQFLKNGADSPDCVIVGVINDRQFYQWSLERLEASNSGCPVIAPLCSVLADLGGVGRAQP